MSEDKRLNKDEEINRDTIDTSCGKAMNNAGHTITSESLNADSDPGEDSIKNDDKEISITEEDTEKMNVPNEDFVTINDNQSKTMDKNKGIECTVSDFKSEFSSHETDSAEISDAKLKEESLSKTIPMDDAAESAKPTETIFDEIEDGNEMNFDDEEFNETDDDSDDEEFDDTDDDTDDEEFDDDFDDSMGLTMDLSDMDISSLIKKDLEDDISDMEDPEKYDQQTSDPISEIDKEANDEIQQLDDLLNSFSEEYDNITGITDIPVKKIEPDITEEEINQAQPDLSKDRKTSSKKDSTRPEPDIERKRRKEKLDGDDIQVKKLSKKLIITVIICICAAIAVLSFLLLFPVKLTAKLTSNDLYQFDTVDKGDFIVETSSLLGLTRKKIDYKIEDSVLKKENNIVVITCEGKSTEIEVPAIGLTSLKAEYAREKAYETDPLKINDITIVASYEDGTEKRVNDITFEDENTEYITSDKVNVVSETYGTLSCQLPYVAVNKVSIKDHEILYAYDEPDYESILLTYTDGTEKIIAIEDAEVSDNFFEVFKNEGVRYMLVKYHGKEYEFGQQIEIRQIKSASANISEGYVDEVPDITSLNITFSDGTTKSVSINDAGFSKLPDIKHKLENGDNKYNFTYNGADGSFVIKGNKYPVESVTYQATDPIYAGEPLPSGKIKIVYSNGDSDLINSRDVEFLTDVSSLKEGSNTVQINHDGQTYTMEINALHVYIMTTSISGVYKAGDSIYNADLTITYNTGKSITVKVQNVEYEDKPLEAGQNNFIYTYEGLQGTFTVMASGSEDSIQSD